MGTQLHYVLGVINQISAEQEVTILGKELLFDMLLVRQRDLWVMTYYTTFAHPCVVGELRDVLIVDADMYSLFLQSLTWLNSASSEALKYQLTTALAGTSPLILQEMQPSLNFLLTTASVSESTSTQAPWHRDASVQRGGKKQSY